MPKFRLKLEKVEEKKPEEKRLTAEELAEKHALLKQERAIISWKSPSRPFKKRGTEYFVTIGLVALILILIATVLREFLLVGVILSLSFVVYVLATVEPETIEHKIVKSGLVSGNHAYLWEELKSFWFEKKYEQELLVIETKLRFPGRLFILISGISAASVKNSIGKNLEFRQVPNLNWLDKAAERLTKLFPLERKV